MKIWQVQKLLNAWTKLTSGSINRNIFGASVTVATATALVKVAAMVKELVVAWIFGIGDALDAFLIALVVPSFLINVIAGSFTSAIIPTYIQVREQEGAKAAQRLFSGTTVWSLGLLGTTTLMTIFTAPLYLPLMAQGFNLEKLNLTFHLLYLLAPLVILSGIEVIWGGLLNAWERFALAAVSPIINPIISIIFLLVLKSWGVFALATGLVCGSLLEIALLGAALQRQGISLLPRWYGFDPQLRQVANQYAPAIVGGVLICSTSIVDQSMAAMLSPGSIAALNYGNRVIALPVTLITTALSTAIVPYFSKMVACEDWAGIRKTLNSYIRLVFAVTVPLTTLLLVFSELIVQILFQRGSFTAQDTALVAQIQNFFALQIPFHTAAIIVVRLIISMKLNHILMWVTGFSLIINIILNYLFIQWIGIKGIALSTSCVYLFSYIYLTTFANKNLNKVMKQ